MFGKGILVLIGLCLLFAAAFAQYTYLPAASGIATGTYEVESGNYTNTTANDTSYWGLGDTTDSSTITAYTELTYNVTHLGNLAGIRLNLTYCHDGSNSAPPACDGTAAEGTANGDQNVEIYNQQTSTWDDIGNLRTDDNGSEVSGYWDAAGNLSDYVSSSKQVSIRYEVNYTNGYDQDSWLVLDYAPFGINDTPDITVESPINGSGYKQTWVWANVTAQDISGIDWCGYSLDGGANTTMSNDTDYHFYTNVSGIPEGYHNITYYCNDTDGNMEASNTTYFRVDLTPPSFYSPSSDVSGYIGLGFYTCLKINVTDNLDVDKVWGEIKLPEKLPKNYTFVDYDPLCGGGYNDGEWELRVNAGALEGILNWTKAYANDTTGNMNSTNVNITLQVMPNKLIKTDYLTYGNYTLSGVPYEKGLICLDVNFTNPSGELTMHPDFKTYLLFKGYLYSEPSEGTTTYTSVGDNMDIQYKEHIAAHSKFTRSWCFINHPWVSFTDTVDLFNASMNNAEGIWAYLQQVATPSDINQANQTIQGMRYLNNSAQSEYNTFYSSNDPTDLMEAMRRMTEESWESNFLAEYNELRNLEQKYSPYVSLTPISGTEYVSGEEINLWVLAMDSTGKPITGASCTATVRNSTDYAIVDSAPMTAGSDAGVYYYKNGSITNEGFYTAYFNCTKSGQSSVVSHSFHIAPWATTINEINATVVSNFTDVRNRLTEINTTTWSTLNNITLVVVPKLNQIQGNLTQIDGKIDNVEAYLNCTNMQNNSVCYRLDLIQNYTDNVEGDIAYVNSTINSYQTINTGRFASIDGNLSLIYNDTQALLAAPNSTLGNLSDILDTLHDVQKEVEIIRSYLSPFRVEVTATDEWNVAETYQADISIFDVSSPVDASSIRARIYAPDDSLVLDTTPTRVDTGVYRVKYVIPTTYNGPFLLVVNADWQNFSVTTRKYFKVRDLFGQYNASVNVKEPVCIEDGEVKADIYIKGMGAFVGRDVTIRYWISSDGKVTGKASKNVYIGADGEYISEVDVGFPPNMDTTKPYAFKLSISYDNETMYFADLFWIQECKMAAAVAPITKETAPTTGLSVLGVTVTPQQVIFVSAVSATSLFAWLLAKFMKKEKKVIEMFD